MVCLFSNFFKSPKNLRPRKQKKTKREKEEEEEERRERDRRDRPREREERLEGLKARITRCSLPPHSIFEGTTKGGT